MCADGESNPSPELGRLVCYHYTTGAAAEQGNESVAKKLTQNISALETPRPSIRSYLTLVRLRELVYLVKPIQAGIGSFLRVMYGESSRTRFLEL